MQVGFAEETTTAAAELARVRSATHRDSNDASLLIQRYSKLKSE
jgi:hypothetical protein